MSSNIFDDDYDNITYEKLIYFLEQKMKPIDECFVNLKEHVFKIDQLFYDQVKNNKSYILTYLADYVFKNFYYVNYEDVGYYKQNNKIIQDKDNVMLDNIMEEYRKYMNDFFTEIIKKYDDNIDKLEKEKRADMEKLLKISIKHIKRTIKKFNNY